MRLENRSGLEADAPMKSGNLSKPSIVAPRDRGCRPCPSHEGLQADRNRVPVADGHRASEDRRLEQCS